MRVPDLATVTDSRDPHFQGVKAPAAAKKARFWPKNFLFCGGPDFKAPRWLLGH